MSRAQIFLLCLFSLLLALPNPHSPHLPLITINTTDLDTVSTRCYLGSLFRFSIGLPLRHSGCMGHPSLSILAWLGPPGSADDFERCDLEQQTISLLRTTALGLNSSDRIYWGRTRKGRWRKTSPGVY